MSMKNKLYEIFIEETAEKELNKLDKSLFNRISQKILALAENPRPLGCKKLKGHFNDYRIRIGNYRVVYEINDDENYFNIMIVRHRKEVYN